jgi:hypothetical protein
MVGPTDHRRFAFVLRSRRVTEGGDVGGCRQLRLAAATTSKRSFSRLVRLLPGSACHVHRDE